MSTSPNDTPYNQGDLGLWDSISIIIGIVIGTTIFQVPWLIFANVPNVWMGLAVWVAGGLLALIGGLCYAELATTYPRSGGDYVYLTRAFGSWVGFLFGWAQLIVILPASIGVMAYVFADFAGGILKEKDIDLSQILNIPLSSEFLIATVVVVFLSLLNIVGVTLGKLAQNVLTAAKVLGLGGILIAGFAWADFGATDWTFPEWRRFPDGFGWGTLAMILVLYAYGGWNDAAFVAAEVRDRRRNIPLALMLGIGGITVIYLLVNAAYILGLGFGKAREFGRLPALLLEKPLGNFGATAMSILVMTSALGAANGLIFTGSRVYATLGEDHRLFGFLGHWKPGRGAPILALAFQALITLGMILALGTKEGHEHINSVLAWVNQTFNLSLEFEREWKAGSAFAALVDHTAPVFWLFFLLTGFSLFKLREKNPTLARPFSVPFYPLLPFIFCNMCIFMLYQSTIYIGWRVLFVVALMAIGVPLFLLSRLLGGNREPA